MVLEFEEDDHPRDDDGKFGAGGGSPSKDKLHASAREAGRGAGKTFAEALLKGAGKFEEHMATGGEKAEAAADAIISGDLDPMNALEAGRLAFQFAGVDGPHSKIDPKVAGALAGMQFGNEGSEEREEE